MPQTQNLTAPTDCLSRAACHDAAAQLLDERGEEWAAVAYFYASYHRVRAAILVDPVFDSLVDLPKVDPRISVQHREISRHEGRIVGGRRDIGVNDLVRTLYRPIYAEYLVLHDASVKVRYGRGISADRLAGVRACWSTVKHQYDAGALVWRGRQD